MRFIGLDVHQGFCEVAIRKGGVTRSAGRVASDRDAIELFAGSLCGNDEVGWSRRRRRAICYARVKSDRFDARTLADLLAAGMLEAVLGAGSRDAGVTALCRSQGGAYPSAHPCEERDPCHPCALSAWPLAVQ